MTRVQSFLFAVLLVSLLSPATEVMGQSMENDKTTKNPIEAEDDKLYFYELRVRSAEVYYKNNQAHRRKLWTNPSYLNGLVAFKKKGTYDLDDINTAKSKLMATGLFEEDIQVEEAETEKGLVVYLNVVEKNTNKPTALSEVYYEGNWRLRQSLGFKTTNATGHGDRLGFSLSAPAFSGGALFYEIGFWRIKGGYFFSPWEYNAGTGHLEAGFDLFSFLALQLWGQYDLFSGQDIEALEAILAFGQKKRKGPERVWLHAHLSPWAGVSKRGQVFLGGGQGRLELFYDPILSLVMSLSLEGGYMPCARFLFQSPLQYDPFGPRWAYEAGKGNATHIIAFYYLSYALRVPVHVFFPEWRILLSFSFGEKKIGLTPVPSFQRFSFGGTLSLRYALPLNWHLKFSSRFSTEGTTLLFGLNF